MKSEFRLYDLGYEDKALRGEDEPRPWNMTEEVLSRIPAGGKILDIGCGTCRKSLRFSRVASEVWGLEPSKPMREAASRRAAEMGIENLHLVEGVAEALPFADEQFDLVCCFIAPQTASEVFRVLKPGGVLTKIGIVALSI